MSRIVSIVANCQSIIIPSQNTPKLQLLGVLEGSQTWSGEVDGRLQAGDLLVIVGVDIGKDVVGSLSLSVSKPLIVFRDWQRSLTGGMAVGRSTLFVMVI
jgi:hypothetical protein